MYPHQKMVNRILHIGEYLRKEGNFGRSDVNWTTATSHVTSPRPYYYRWHSDEQGMDIVTQEDPSDPHTARLYSYPISAFCRGVDLERDQPIATGKAILDFLLGHHTP